jgi:hypothetical protein
MEVTLKRAPVESPNPIIIVTAQDTPPDLPLEAYADIDRSHVLEDTSVHAVGGITTTSIDGERAESYVTRDSRSEGLELVAYRRGVVYMIQFAAPLDQYEAAKAKYLHAFLSTWRWN